ncbi:MAG: hypothetical protein ABL983_13085 [Nitrospira sp.]
MSSNDPDFSGEVSDRSKAARVLGGYVVLAAVVLGVFGLLIVVLLRLSFADFKGWYYLFLAAVLAVYLLYQRLAK